jgi:hypothetical protein
MRIPIAWFTSVRAASSARPSSQTGGVRCSSIASASSFSLSAKLRSAAKTLRLRLRSGQAAGSAEVGQPRSVWRARARQPDQPRWVSARCGGPGPGARPHPPRAAPRPTTSGSPPDSPPAACRTPRPECSRYGSSGCPTPGRSPPGWSMPSVSSLPASAACDSARAFCTETAAGTANSSPSSAARSSKASLGVGVHIHRSQHATRGQQRQ